MAVDTSVAVPAILADHEAHEAVVARLEDSTARLSGHALFETYAVLTRLPAGVRLSPGDAATLLAERFGRPVPLDGPALAGALEELVAATVAGGAAYDGLIGLAARAHGLKLLTRDVRAVGTYHRLGVDAELMH